MASLFKIARNAFIAGALTVTVAGGALAQGFGDFSPEGGPDSMDGPPPFEFGPPPEMAQGGPQQGGFGGQQGGFGGQGGQHEGRMQRGGGQFGGGPQGGGQFGGQGGQNGNMREKMREKMAQELGITPEQQAELKKIEEASRAQSENIRKQVGEKRKALMEYMASPDATESQAMAKSKELAALQQQMGELRIKTWFQIKGKMTPEQQQKMRTMRENMKGKMGEFRQKRQQQGGGGQFRGQGGQGPQRNGQNFGPPQGPPQGQGSY